MGILEVCVDSAECLSTALEGGADRIELCSAVEIGGLTPSQGFIGQAVEMAKVPIYGMVRPRAGDFVYSELEIETMEREIEAMRASKVAGIVFGANRRDGRLDEGILEKLARRAQGMGMTLHRSVDLVPDLEEAIKCAIRLGFGRILTSGREMRAIDGLEDLREMGRIAGGRIEIMPGAGINSENLDKIMNKLHWTREIHSSCTFCTKDESEKHSNEGEIIPKKIKIKMEKFGFCGKLEKRKTNLKEVRRMKEILKQFC